MSDLDDFFAKKSRKKKTKTSSAVLAGDLLNQKKEQEVRKQKKLKDKDDKGNEPLSTLLKKTVEDDEWNDLETEKEPTAADLSRIQNLAISRDKEQTRDGEERSNTGVESEDNVNEESDRQAAAWGISGSDPANSNDSGEENESCEEQTASSKEPPTPTPSAKETPEETPTETETSKPATTKAYIAPHLRNRSTQGSEFSLGGTSDHSSGRKFVGKVKAPDIGNVEEFPTLGGKARNDANSVAADNGDRRGFTKVQHGVSSNTNTRSGYTRYGSRSDGIKGRGSESLSLENRYATLSEDM